MAKAEYQGSDGGLYLQRQRVLYRPYYQEKNARHPEHGFWRHVDYFHLRYQVNQQATLFPAAYLNERHKHVNKEEECRHVVESFLRYLLSP